LVLKLNLSIAQQAPLSADEVMKNALRAAAIENKKVFIIFHASWCGWCRKMDSSMNDRSCKQFFEDNYVIRHLDVDEFSDDKKALQNPGANELRSRYYGDSVGIPFWLIFDKEGNLLADSKLRSVGSGLEAKGDNVGCPAEETEIRYFIKVLRETSRISPQQEDMIVKRFRLNKE